MEVNGREVRFWFSVGAKYEIGSLDQGMDDFTRTVKTAAIMSRAHEQAQKYKGEETVRPLEEAEVMAMSDDEFAKLCEEIAAAFKEGNVVTVEAEEPKKKEGEAPS